MKNNVPISGIQFDMLLPNGISADATTDRFGDVAITAGISGTRINPSKFNFSVAFPEANNNQHITVLCYATNSNVAVGEGEVFTITINADKDIQQGEYPIILRNVVVSNTNDTYDNTKDITSMLTVGTASRLRGDVNEDGVVDIKDVTDLVEIITGKTK